MKLWLANKWDSLSGSFWFLPTLMVIAAIGLSLMTIHLDRATVNENWLATLGWTFSRGPEGSRALLATVAGSMMTIASVTFSITIVALQLASSQFGPRLLRNFMRDRGNQVAIGTFIATFTYCLLILRTVNGTDSEQFVPHISVTVALMLALISVGVLIYFIHHSAESIQAENVIAAVSRDLHFAIEELYPERLGHEAPDESNIASERELPADFNNDHRKVDSPRSDYLQAINVDRLFADCDRARSCALDRADVPENSVLKAMQLHSLGRPRKSTTQWSSRFVQSSFFGHRRTLLQDVEFAIDQLVEVAVRALSPGVNDPFTAINCVDRLGAALCDLADKVIPSPYRYDEDGKLRVVTDASTVQGIVDASFDQIRQAARKDTSVTVRLLETIAAVARQTDAPAFRTALHRQADAIHRGSHEGLADGTDREDANRRFREAIEALNGTHAVSV